MKKSINVLIKYALFLAIIGFLSTVNIKPLEAAAPAVQGVNLMISRLTLPKDREAITGFFQNSIDKNLILKDMTITITIYDTSNNIIRKNSKTIELPNIYLPASGKSSLYKFEIDDPGNKAYTNSVVTKLAVQINWRPADKTPVL